MEEARDKAQTLCDLVYPGIDDLLDQAAHMDEINVIVRRRN